MRQPGEPSVEEILDSIKKVIARDSRNTGAAAPAPGAAPDQGARRPMPAHTMNDVLDLAVSAQFLDPPSPGCDMPERDHDRRSGFTTPGTGATQPQDNDPSLVAADARASMRESLAALAMMAQPGAAPQIVRTGETSLEGLTRELLRPALAAWLDTHLPAMVEQMVATEIAKIVGKKG